jgi:hypothetical protein
MCAASAILAPSAYEQEAEIGVGRAKKSSNQFLSPLPETQPLDETSVERFLFHWQGRYSASRIAVRQAGVALIQWRDS